ncbi:hypothetical protein [Tenacibaculum agarivorans]|uniref:hypothetical protein n=1 Tax=Tenacibaculum agarivorans TaxID=1908389 RepID=UPI00094BC4EF|nr:hypothetical protein [Tenacibaculum agarivorans]
MTQKILKAVMVVLVLIFVTSCENNEIESFDTDVSTIEQPIPTLPKFFKKKVAQVFAKAKDSMPQPSNPIFSWALKDGSYFERLGNRIVKNFNAGTVTETYTITHVDANFIMASHTTNGNLIALPTWSVDNLRNYFQYNSNSESWDVIDEVRYQIQTSQDDFDVFFNYINPDRIRLRWIADSPENFSKYRHDVFLNDEKVQENYTKSFAWQYLTIPSLQAETDYKLKIVAKDQDNEGRLKFKKVEFRTPKKIEISDFKVSIDSITRSGFKVYWTTPKVSSTKPIQYNVHLSSNVLGTVLGSSTGNSMVIDSLPISKDIDFSISVVAAVASDEKGAKYTEYKRIYAEKFELLD